MQGLTDRKLRILSLPCSTGEEPYSIALTLLGAGLSLDQFEIDAIDISTHALNIARHGHYNTKPLGPLWAKSYRYWSWQDQSLQISPTLAQSIHFKLGNVMDWAAQNSSQAFNASDLRYDVIFCRNLLIYFDPETRQNVLQAFDRSLRSEGLLFVGHAETGALGRDRWEIFPHSHAFAYQKIKPQPANKRSVPKAPKSPVRSALSVPPHRPSYEPKTIVSLARSQELADAGQLDAALAICEKHLKIQPLCGEGYFLMGQICQAIGLFDARPRRCVDATGIAAGKSGRHCGC
jgi:chemotaxis protein methyltransferase WspC